MPKSTISAMETKISDDPRIRGAFINNRLKDQMIEQNVISSPNSKNNDVQNTSNATEAMWKQ